MTISYAGVPLSAPTAATALAVEQAVPTRDLYPFQRWSWAGRNRTGWTFPGFTADRPVKVGSLHWPCNSASRWAVGHFLATESQLNQIRPLVYTGANKYESANLVLSDGVNTLTTALWMLPPRPLFQITGSNPTYLLTLVDDRYFWWQAAGNTNVDVFDATSWLALSGQVETALSIAMTLDATPAAYMVPPKDLIAHYEYLPLLLDAIHYNTGRRVVRQTNGTLLGQNPVNAAASAAAQAALATNPTNPWKKMAGGNFLFAANQNPTDIFPLLPESVTVTFSPVRYVTVTCEPFTVNVTLASLALPELGGATPGYAGTKVFHDSALPAYDDSGNLLNGAELTALATQIATDWYRFQLGSLDTVYNGIVPWVMDALHDSVEWTHRDDLITTRVQRPAWDDLTEETLHAGSYGSNFDLTPNAGIRIPANATRSGGYVSGYLQVKDPTTGQLVDGPLVWTQNFNA